MKSARERIVVGILMACLSQTATLVAQSPLANIEGRVTDGRTTKPIAVAIVRLEPAEGGLSIDVPVDLGGRFLIPLQQPREYRISVSATGYQTQLLNNVSLRTGALLTLDFEMRPSSDILERGRFRTWTPQGSRTVLSIPGPDFDASTSVSLIRPTWNTAALTPSISESISPLLLRELPLAGRDAYAMLVFLPSVSSDSSTSRGLGYTPNGQRPSSTHFLLDGQANDDSTVSGPGILLPPEAVAEYRAAVGSFSAEFGGTTGLVANAVTNSGGPIWHGRLYSYLKNDVLNANGFQQNRSGLPRAPWKELHLGGNAGGPIVRNRLYMFGSLERFRSRRRQDPEEIYLPTQNYKLYSTPNSFARSILDRFGGGVLLTSRNSSSPVGSVTLAKPLSLDNNVSLLRIDHSPEGSRAHTFLRLMGSRQVRPDFIWSPYPDFQSALSQTAGSALLASTVRLSSAITLEARVSYGMDDTGWDRAHPEVPTLSAGDVYLPGSPAFYAYRNRNLLRQSSGAVLVAHGGHLVKLGVGLSHRRQNSLLTAGRDGLYLYSTFPDFGADWPLQLQVSTPRAGGTQSPDFGRQYGIWQGSGYVQDDWRLRPGTSVYFGVRYEYFGAPLGKTAETVISGDSLASSRFVQSGAGLFQADRNNLGFRIGLSQRLGQRAIFRSGAGVNFDRGFDNLWQTIRSNSFVLKLLPFDRPSTLLSMPVRTVLEANRARLSALSFPEGALLQTDLRSPYAWNQFASVEYGLGRSTWATLGAQGSLGRKLITTDRINRLFSVAATAVNPYGIPNPQLPVIAYRGNQGVSSFWGLQAGLRHTAGSRAIAVQYTWSHAIDLQSEPLAGDFFDLNFSRAQFGENRESNAAFSRQFMPAADRGNSSFDQRHILSTIATIPLPVGFRLSGLFSLRSGLPYTVLSGGFSDFDQEVIYGRRPDLVGRANLSSQTVVDGGKRLLDESAFAIPFPGSQGTLGRNSLREKGFVGLDVSVSRTFRPWRIHDRAPSLILRADAFNTLNHTNLGTPNRNLGDESFGVASYGRTGRSTGFPGLTPFSETPRQVQLLLRVEF